MSQPSDQAYTPDQALLPDHRPEGSRLLGQNHNISPSYPVLGHSYPVIDRARCVYCRRCAEACPTGAPYRDGDAFTVDYNLCTACRACLAVCRTDAISLCKPQKTASASGSGSSA